MMHQIAASAPSPTASVPEPTAFPSDGRRVILYVIDDRRGDVPDHAFTALRELARWASAVVAIVARGTSAADLARLRDAVDEVVEHDGPGAYAAYSTALRAARVTIAGADEVVFTGDSWYGPARPLAPIFDRMDSTTAHLWQMTGNIDGAVESFPEEGFPGRPLTWLWIAVRRALLDSAQWARAWSALGKRSEHEFVAGLSEAGFTAVEAFPARNYPRGDPALFAPDLLLDDGFPFLSKTVFAQYPPLLDRHAVLGRELLSVLAQEGFDLAETWRDLARTVAPKALNTIAGMLEVLPEYPPSDGGGQAHRLAVIAYVPDVAFVDELRARLVELPHGFDLFVTTGDGARAQAIDRMLTDWPDPPFQRFETRVSWARRGRDKAALFMACRDVILGDDYDLLIVVNGRVSSRKTANMRDYSRRYQLDNVLGSAGYVENLLELFRKEPGLGLVFPPMAHIGNTIMGRGWGPYREAAVELCRRMGVRVPLDRVTPLAPFGGTWIGRPAAVRPLAEVRWTVNDYNRANRRKHVQLGSVQERILPLVAAEQGYHCRTVINGEHAAISHTSLEYKADQLFSTTRGYPVEQIRFMHRAGFTGHGGVVALSRMYLRVNHPLLSRLLLPLYSLSYWAFTIPKLVRRGLHPTTADEGSDR
ncbi:rhamnan synthesis F family protein [Microbacterium sp. BWT-B31]|uniref:rhamnan synthesis F family protein n=1 Tax=Microbacterium sp. BWT-B31 TaxID=3232072 RepID=UPI003527355E